MATLSVVMPSYCQAPFLAKTIESVLAQSLQPDEYIILDDASTDKSAEIIDSYARLYPTIRFIRNPVNRGAGYTGDRLFKEAVSDYIISLGPDDIILPGFFENVMKMANQYPEAGIIFGKMGVVDMNGEPINIEEVKCWQTPLYASPEVFIREYLNTELPNHQLGLTMAWKRSALVEINYFCEELGSFLDTFAARAIALKYGACYVPEVFACWRYDPNSFSNKNSSNASYYIDQLELAEKLMRSPDFKDRFPEEYILNWSHRYRNMLLERYSSSAMHNLNLYKNKISKDVSSLKL